MESKVRQEIDKKELILTARDHYVENYELKMIHENKIKGILKTTKVGMNGCTNFIYDISGLKSFKEQFQKENLVFQDLQLFIKQFLGILKELRRYFLVVDNVILDPEYIYYGQGNYYFVYYPMNQTSLDVGFHMLTEYIVKAADYNDEKTILLAAQLHKESMEETYNLEILLNEKVIEDVQEDNLDVVRDDLYEDSWIDVKEQSSNVLREESVGRVWRGKREGPWGRWDDLPLLEESSIMNL